MPHCNLYPVKYCTCFSTIQRYLERWKFLLLAILINQNNVGDCHFLCSSTCVNGDHSLAWQSCQRALSYTAFKTRITESTNANRVD